MNSSENSIQINATFTAEPVRDALLYWGDLLGWDTSIRFAGYGQVLQESLDHQSNSATNGASGLNIFLLRSSDLGETMHETVDAIRAFAGRSRAPLLVILCPDRVPQEGSNSIVERLGGITNLVVHPSAYLTDLYPLSNIFDPIAEQSGRIPYTEEYYAALATMIARHFSARSRPPAKVLVLDADNTLWGGICGEASSDELDMESPLRSVREFALEKKDSGMLLCLVSKNQEADVNRVFQDRAEDLLLKKEDFSAWKVSWNPKSQSIREIAIELNLGLESFVFLDDNPTEIAEVTANCPGVIALTLPQNESEIPTFLRHIWPLDIASVTAADSTRADFYRQDSARRDLQNQSTNFGDFLKGLELKVEIRETTADDLPRFSQLTIRTNQFTANPIHLSETELTERISSGATALSVVVSDRFGDYGLVGGMLISPGTDLTSHNLSVERFLLSCRAMGKGVERAMVIALAERAQILGATSLSIAYTKTDRNEPCRRFFEEIGGFELSTADAIRLSPFPETREPLVAADPTVGDPLSPASIRLDAALALRIAGELHRPAVLQRLIRSRTRPRPELSQAFVKAGTKTQRTLASIWREILCLDEVGLDDPFSSLGGSSIQLVRLYVAIRAEFDVALELVELFSLPTIAAQSARIEADQSSNLEVAPVNSATTSELPGSDDAVAIIGVALRVPGANDPDQFWKNLLGGVESLSRFGPEEIDYPTDYAKPGYIPVKGLIDNVDLFDANFFGILPKDAKIMDPQQRIFLELAWEAMERSGYTPETHRQRIGVYAGAYFDSYLLTNLCSNRQFLADLIPQIQVGTLQTELGNDKDYLATRIAFKLNLRGPAMTLQTACSTSMVAVIEACRAIRSGLCDMALAGGITVTLPLKRGYFYTEEGMLSGDGHCRAFDESASGTVFGNGAGVVMLKRLSDAVRDRDHIHAVIRGTGMNNDGGVKHSFTAPSVAGQTDVIRMAHQDAGVSADSIGYIEAHGTGTPLGDPIEVTALTKAFRSAGVSENQFCALGSLKTNIGHLDVASGVCGLIKTAFSLEKAMLPPTLHFRKANPKIDFETSPFYVNASLTPWTEGRNGHPRRAGISAFGVGGTNAHVVLEEAPLVDSLPSARPHQLFLLSARSEEALKHAGENLHDFALAADSTDPADAAWTLAIGRKPFRCRRAIAATDLTTLADAIASGGGVSGIAERFNPPVHFLFPGQGSQHVNMGRAFYEGEPRFRELVDRCSEILRPHLGLTLTDVLYPKSPEDLAGAAEQLKNTVLAQPAIFVVEYAFADLWMSCGVVPTAMIGHSVGEFVAACHAGVFDLESGLGLLATRGRLMGDLPSGGMLSVRMSEADLLDRLPAALDLAAINGPSLCVVAGPHEELEKFHAVLEAEEIVSQTLHTSHAFHSRMMEPVIDRFAAAFDGITLSAPTIPILSTVTGEWLTEKETTDPYYWAKHLREPVRFHRAVRRLGEEHPEQIFVEVGPGQTLTGLARQTLNRKDKHLFLSTNRHIKEEGCDHENFLESLGALWTSGVEIDWEGFYSGEIRKRVILPTYPFERKRHWVEATPMHEAAESPSPLPTDIPFPEPTAAEPVMSHPVPLCRRETIAGAIREILTDLSGIPDEELAGDASFLEQGFDSLLLTQVSRSLQNEFKTEITLRLLMGDLSSIEAMAKHLDAALPPEAYRMPVPEPLHPAIQVASATITPPASLPPHSATVLTASPSALPSYPPMHPGIVLEGVIAQQLEVMRQQIALLQGSGGSVVTPALTVAPTLTSVPSQDIKPPATTPASTDVSAPTTAINRSIDSALTDRQQRHLHELIAKYTAKTHSSKTLTAKYRQWHADPRTVSGFNRNWKEMIYQISVKQSKGSRLLDVDGNEYIDLLNGFGPNFLGHSPDFVTEALHAQLDRGVEVGPQCVNAMEAAQLFCEITGNERASFVNTGSEAVQAAMRLARTVTGRDKIVVFTKDYHGNFDEVLVKGVGSGASLRSLPIAPGIPRRAVDDIIVLPYGTEEALDFIRTRAGELAAVIIEPVQSRRPEFQPREFIREVREITRQSGTVFVFDEVITGFRTGPRGAQEFYGVEADIATYGKVVGGGMPLGVVAGKAEFMDTFDGGMWQYGDDSFPEKGVTFFAGTFVRHPLAMAAVKAVLLHLREKGPEFWETVKSRANRLAETVDRLFVENNVPIRMPNFGTQMFLRVAEDHKYANLFFFHLRNKGVFLLEGFPTYMTAAHTDADIDYCIAAFRESIAEMQEGGFFEVPSGVEVPHLNGSRLTGPPRQLDHGSPLSLSPAHRSSLALPKDPVLFPMTESLAEIWLASQISENASRCFNEINTLTLRGSLKIDALKTSLQDLVDRHDSLRAAFPASGEGFTVRAAMEMPISQIDLESLSADDRAEAIEKAIGQERELIFDLERDPLFRASILKVSADEHLLILNAHHLVCDGWSYTIVLEELGAIYRDRSMNILPTLDPSASFGAYCLQTTSYISNKKSNPSETFWMEQFSAPVSPLALPADFAAIAEPDFRCDMVADHFNPAEVKALKQAAGKSGASLFGLLMSAYQIMLHRVCRQQRFVVGFPAAGQNGTGHESLIGHCVNFLPFVAEVDPDSDFTTFLKKTQGRLLDALDHQDFTYGRLIQNFSSGERPVVEAVFNLEKVKNSLAMPGIESSVAEIERGYVSNPLFLKVREYEEGLEIRLDYQSSLFSGETVRQWLCIFRGILESIITAPTSSVRALSSSLGSAQLDQLKGWNLTKVEYPRDSSIHGLFSEVAAARGSKTALRFDGGEMSYEELDRASDGLARFLVNAGAVPGSRIGIFLERSPLLISSILAVLKTGATYLPLDPGYPEERLELMIRNSEVLFVITDESLQNRLHGETQAIVIDKTSGASLRFTDFPDVSAEAGAFILYTSGSTGIPKGSLGTHRNLVRLVKNVDYCELNENETLLLSSSICFDASLFEIFGALLNGGTLVIPPAEKLSLDAISRSLTEHKVTTLWLTAGLFQIMIEECPEALSGLRQLISGGDVMTVNHASRLLKMYPHIHLINGYGPTENGTFSTSHRVTKGDLTRTTIPIGRPIPNSTVWILDKDRKPVQPGVAAELFTGGDGVALEYINDPVRTAEKFFPDPFSDDPHGRLYATGDLGRHRHDGTIEFLGRIDHQIKIRGFRVEPGEIEALLSRHPRVGQCKIVVSGSLASDKSLHAYVKPINGVKPSAGELSEFLRSSLPEYLIPSRILVLDEMPLNANGKIDTRSLPEINAAEPEISRELTATEKSLTEMWSDFLRIPDPELDDDFFSLGGHSLLGMKVFVRIQKQFGISLPLATIFKAPTIRKLAALIDERQAALNLSQNKATALEVAVNSASDTGEPAHILNTISESQTIAETTVAIRSEGHLPPLFAVHGGNGGILFYGNLAERLGNDRPFYAFEAPALTGGGPLPEESVEETAANYLQELRKVQAVGPYHLCGYSFGGVVAYEMARQLLAAEEDVEFLGLVDTENPSVDGRKLSLGERISVNWNDRNESEAGTIARVSNLGKRISSGLGYRLRFGAEDAIASSLPSSNKTGWLRQAQLRKAHERAMEAYLPGKFPGKLTLFRAMVGNDKFDIGDDYGWNSLVDELEVIGVPGNHISIFHQDNIDAVSKAFRNCLRRTKELQETGCGA